MGLMYTCSLSRFRARGWFSVSISVFVSVSVSSFVVGHAGEGSRSVGIEGKGVGVIED
jgi:hypothetical protein